MLNFGYSSTDRERGERATIAFGRADGARGHQGDCGVSDHDVRIGGGQHSARLDALLLESSLRAEMRQVIATVQRYRALGGGW